MKAIWYLKLFAFIVVMASLLGVAAGYLIFLSFTYLLWWLLINVSAEAMIATAVSGLLILVAATAWFIINLYRKDF